MDNLNMEQQRLLQKCEEFAIECFKQTSEFEEQWHHTKLVRESCLKLAQIEEVDPLIVEIAALFHDIGQINDYANHHLESVKLAQPFLEETDLERDVIDQILLCISKHRSTFSKEKGNPLEVKILQSADMLSRLFDEEYFAHIMNSGNRSHIEYWHQRTQKKINLASARELASPFIEKMKAALGK